MTQRDKPQSQIVPILAAALVCDVACVDPNSGKHTLIGIFDVIHVRNFPSRRHISVYLKITNAEGAYEFDVRFVQVATNKILVGAKGNFEVKSRVIPMGLYIPFPPFDIPSDGRYEFQVWANTIYLGSTCIDVEKSA